MDGATATAENVIDNTQDTQQPNPLPEQSPEELIPKIAEILDNLFESNSIVNNSYFLNRAVNENFEIPIQALYNERSIRNETFDSNIVNQALENTRNIIVNKKGDAIVSVTPRHNEAKRKITVRNITREKKEEFRNFIYSLEETKEGTCYWNYNGKLNVATLACKEEAFAARLFDVLQNIKFNEEDLDCSLDNDNLYITGLEIMKKKARTYGFNQMNAMNQMAMPMYGYTGYPMQMYPMYPTANNFYVTNHYQNMNYYYPNMSNAPYAKPMYNPGMNMNQSTNQNQGMNPNPGYNKKPYNPNYRNDKKPYSKQKKQFNKDKNYKYNNNRASTKSNSIEVNDNEFPPL